jgi:iron complex outermembrane receptor protein
MRRISWQAALLLGTLTFAAAVSGPLQAQSGQAQPAQQQFSIPAQSLNAALDTFARHSGWQVGYPAAMAQGKTSTAVQGSLTPPEALARLLAGSGLTYRVTGPNTVTLVELPPGSSGAAVLPPVVVQGNVQNTESSYGQVDGYVATRAASATKTDTPLNETPQSVSVITRDEMDIRNARTLGDALGYTAGVRAGTMGDSSGYGGDSTSIRGFGGDGTSGASSNEYIDGLRIGGAGYVAAGFDPFFFERVEVLKGPASVLYGQSTPGGIVNMVSKRPTETPFHEVEVQTGSYNRKQASFDISERYDEGGKVFYRLTGLAFDTETQTDFSDRKRVAIAPAITLRPSDDTSLTILTRYQNDDFGGSALNWLPARGTVLPGANGNHLPSNFFGGDPNYMQWDRENYAVGYVLEHTFNDTWTVRQNARYMHNTLDYKGVYISTMQANQITANRQAFGMIEHSDDFTIDNQAQAKFDTAGVKHTVLAGMDNQVLMNDTNRVLQSTAPTLNIYAPVYYQTFSPGTYQKSNTRAEQNGLYAQDQMKYENWIVLLGLRQDWANSQTHNELTRTMSTQRDGAFTKRGALMYAFDSGISPYISYTESFDPTVGSFLSPGVLAKPSEGQQQEFGVKYQPPGYNSFITASVFDLVRSNVTASDPARAGYVTQTGEVTTRGLELEGKASLANGLNLTAAYTYLDAEVTSSRATATGINGGVVALQGKEPVKIPEHSGSLWADYAFSSGTLRGLGLGSGIRYVGETNGDQANSFMVPSFTLVDAALRYDLVALSPSLQGWKTGLTATNLFDKEYVSACSAAVRCYYGTGRTIFASLKYSW